jgi:uncharacterized repeat protein (TIGR01451 family)
MKRHLYSRLSLLAALSLITILLAVSVPAVPAAQEALPDRPIPGLSQELDHYTGDPIPSAGAAASPWQQEPAQTENVPWSKLVFQSYRDNNWEIYAANGDGTAPARLTVGNTADIHPRLNRGTTRIVFSSNLDGDYEIYAMNLDGSGRVQLTFNTTDDVNPDWSADSSQIVFESYRDGQPEIYAMHADGSGQTRLTNDADYDGMPVWSPGGLKIAFVSRRTGGYRIYSMTPDGANLTQLSAQAYSLYPGWSPNGAQISYSADQDGDGFFELWRMNADGTGQQQLFDPGSQVDAWGRNWSADGRYIGFTRIAFIFYQGNWYWTEAYLDGWDTTNGSLIRVSSSNTDWHPGWQTSDTQKPISSINALPAQSPGLFWVTWFGSDLGPSGLRNYDIQVRDGANGSWTNWQMNTTATSAPYSGIGGHIYYFRARARDNALNLEEWPVSHDTVTTVEALPPQSTFVNLPPYLLYESTIQWIASDPGGSAIVSYDVQYKQGVAGSWINWQMNTTATSADFEGTPGETYYFRVRARDTAQNEEPWPAGNGDASTSLYAWSLSGIIYDHTDTPITGALANTNPAAFASIPTNLQGQYASYVAADQESYSATWAKNGYGSLPETFFTSASKPNAQFAAILPPSNNLVANWDFETGSLEPAWDTSGTTAPLTTTARQHTGGYAALLGQSQTAFAPTDNFGSIQLGEDSSHMVVDTNGVLHLVWSGDVTDGSIIYYAQRTAGGTWSTPQNLSNLAGDNLRPKLLLDQSHNLHLFWQRSDGTYHKQRTGNNWSNSQKVVSSSEIILYYEIAVDHHNRIHLAWVDYEFGNTKIYYQQRGNNGVWSAAQELGNADFANIRFAIDQDDTVHIIWGANNPIVLRYAQLPFSGSWSPPQSISNPSSHSLGPQILVGEDRNVHVVWYFQGKSGDAGIYHVQRDITGTWSTPQRIVLENFSFLPEVVMGADGVIHLVTNGGLYTQRSTSGLWSEPILIAYPFGRPKIALDGQGTIHALWVGHDGGEYEEIFYHQRLANGVWLPFENLSDNPEASIEPHLVVTNNGVVHVTWHDPNSENANLSYRGPLFADTDSNSILTQAVTIPISMSTPILSFLYRLESATPGSGSTFHVSIQDENMTTLLTTNALTSNWQHQWFDLSAWAGQTITLTFEVEQAADTLMMRAYLDEVSVGSSYPDLWIMGGESAALPGESIVYTLYYGNRGGAAAANNLITHTLPAELTFVSASLPPISASPLVWDVGSLPAKSGPFAIVVTATVSASAEPFTDLMLPVTITTTSAELEMVNNTIDFIIHLFRSTLLPIIMR